MKYIIFGYYLNKMYKNFTVTKKFDLHRTYKIEKEVIEKLHGTVMKHSGPDVWTVLWEIKS